MGGSHSFILMGCITAIAFVVIVELKRLRHYHEVVDFFEKK